VIIDVGLERSDVVLGHDVNVPAAVVLAAARLALEDVCRETKLLLEEGGEGVS
jgi:hypothetical protein